MTHRLTMEDKLKPPATNVFNGVVFCKILGCDIHVCGVVDSCPVTACKAKKKM